MVNRNNMPPPLTSVPTEIISKCRDYFNPRATFRQAVRARGMPTPRVQRKARESSRSTLISSHSTG